MIFFMPCYHLFWDALFIWSCNYFRKTVNHDHHNDLLHGRCALSCWSGVPGLNFYFFDKMWSTSRLYNSSIVSIVPIVDTSIVPIVQIAWIVPIVNILVVPDLTFNVFDKMLSTSPRLYHRCVRTPVRTLVQRSASRDKSAPGADYLKGTWLYDWKIAQTTIVGCCCCWLWWIECKILFQSMRWRLRMPARPDSWRRGWELLDLESWTCLRR